MTAGNPAPPQQHRHGNEVDTSCTLPGCIAPHASADAPVAPSVGLPAPADAWRAFHSDRGEKGTRRAVSNLAWRFAWTSWRFVRQVSGDDAYDRYAEHMRLTHPDQPAMERAEFFRFMQDQKWNRISRCC